MLRTLKKQKKPHQFCINYIQRETLMSRPACRDKKGHTVRRGENFINHAIGAYLAALQSEARRGRGRRFPPVGESTTQIITPTSSRVRHAPYQSKQATMKPCHGCRREEIVWKWRDGTGSWRTSKGGTENSRRGENKSPLVDVQQLPVWMVDVNEYTPHLKW